MVSTGSAQLDGLLVDGYPSRSAVLVVGPAGIGKEALGYWFMSAGLERGDSCLYVTSLSVHEVLEDQKGFGIDRTDGGLGSSSGGGGGTGSAAGSGNSGGSPVWLAAEGGDMRCELNDLSRLSSQIKEVARRDAGRPLRIVMDVLSPLLMLNTPETIYRFLSQLLLELKRYDVVILATLEDEMHNPQTVAAMEQRFDGVLEMKLYEKGLTVIPLLRVRKMRGVPPHPNYFHFSFAHGRLEVSNYAG